MLTMDITDTGDMGDTEATMVVTLTVMEATVTARGLPMLSPPSLMEPAVC